MADPLAYWLATSFGAAVKGHIDNGLKVFPVHGIDEKLKCTCGKECSSPGKHPYAKTAPNGLLNASGDLETVAEMFEYRTDLNVAVATGHSSGILVIDIDSTKGGDESLDRIQEVMGALPETMTLLTGNGKHLVFDYPGVKIKSGTNVFGKEYPGIDLRCDGGYIVIYPSLHYTGRYYMRDEKCSALSDAPKVYLDFLLAEKKQEEKPIDRNERSGNKSEWSDDDIQGMLDFLSPDMDYHAWIAVGMALHREGCPFSMWDGWSSRGSKYKNATDVHKHWRSFRADGERTIGTIIEWAMLQGWRPPQREYVRSPELSTVVDKYVSKLQKKPEPIKKPLIEAPVPSKPDDVDDKNVVSMPINGSHVELPTTPNPIKFHPFKFDPLKLGGILGDTVRWINKHAVYEQPELALLNTLSFAGSVFGRKYKSPIDTRTNIYLVGIADTGAGKDHSRKMITKLAMYSGLDNFIGGNAIRSDTGMLRGLMNHSCQLLMLDEFGILMQAISDPSSPHHVRMISKALMTLYSDSNSIYHHGDYADEKAKPIKIIAPNLCIYGTTTLSRYLPSLRRSAIESGELNRFLVIPSSQDIRPRKIPLDSIMNEKLFAWWKQFAPGVHSKLGELVNSANVVPAPKEVKWGKCEDLAFSILEEQTLLCKNKLDIFRALWSRLYENTMKIAMIFAIARDPENPEFIQEDFTFAYSMVRHSIECMREMAGEGMAENPHEELYNEMAKYIKSSGKTGANRTELLKSFTKRNKRKDVEDMLVNMIESEVVMVDKVMPSGTGRPTVFYKFVNVAA